MNPITQALVNAKNYLTGTSFVDNESNPASALNVKKRQAIKRKMGTPTSNPTEASLIPKKGQVLGTPPGGPNQLSHR